MCSVINAVPRLKQTLTVRETSLLSIYKMGRVVRRVQIPLRCEGAARICGHSGRARKLGNLVHGGGPHEQHVERPSLFWERWDQVWGERRLQPDKGLVWCPGCQLCPGGSSLAFQQMGDVT